MRPRPRLRFARDWPVAQQPPILCCVPVARGSSRASTAPSDARPRARRVCAKHACTSCCACRQTCCSDRPSTPTMTSAARLAVPLPAGTSRQPLSSPPCRQRATSRALPRLPSRPCSAQPQPPMGSRPPTPVPIAPRRSARPCQRPRHSDCYRGTTARCRRRMLPTAHAPHFPRLHGRRRCPRRCRCGRAQRRARRCWQGLVGASRRIRRAV